MLGACSLTIPEVTLTDPTCLEVCVRTVAGDAETTCVVCNIIKLPGFKDAAYLLFK